VTQRSSFEKTQRARDKQAKAAAKRGRRQERQSDPEGAEEPGPILDGTGATVTAAELLGLVETVHRQFEAGTINFDTFEETKTALLSRLPVD
jgi:hypothetical protein